MSAATLTLTLTPTAEQQAVIEHPLSPLLVVAGAGTGKTTTMAARILHLVTSGAARADQILGLTFTNKAAKHLKEEVRRRLDDADVTVATYHSFAASLVSEHILELGLDRGTELLNKAQAWQLLFGVFDEFRFEHRSSFSPQHLLDDAIALASRAADHLVAIDDVAEDCKRVVVDGRWKMGSTAAGRLELCQVVAAYERRKRERNVIDFGDQLALAVKLVRERPDLAEAYREQHPVVLLDEYQDTNFAQRKLLQLLYPPGSAITAVGDDMQSIYAFRGAHLANIQRFTEHFPPVELRALQTSFRFGFRLVQLANRIQRQVEGSLPKELAALPDAPDTTIECFVASDDAEEAATIAADIVEAGAPWGANAVLCRKRRLIPAVVRALEEQAVPVEVIGASGLLDRPEVVDLVAWLEVLADLGAAVALLRILQGPRYAIGRGDVVALARHARALGAPARGGEDEVSLADALASVGDVVGLSDEARSRLGGFCRDRAALSEAATRLPVVDLAETVIQHTGLWQAAGARGRENLLRFLDLAGRFAPIEGDPGLPAFLEHLQLLDESEEDVAEAVATDTDAVKVMTIHQAKGLEFDVVHVPGLAGSGSSRIFPDNRGGDNAISDASALPWWLREDDEGIPDWRTAKSETVIRSLLQERKLHEEWRLFYVACTRARRRLICSAAQWYPGPAEPQGPSAFYDFVAGQTDLVVERFRHEPAEVDPEVAAKQRQRAASERRYAALVDGAANGGGASVAHQLTLDHVEAAPRPNVVRGAPTGLSVTALVSYARCPKQFYWSVVRPLPRRGSSAARLGTEVHRWIEQRAGRQLVLLEPDDADEPDVTDAELVVGGGDGRTDAATVADGLKRAFLGSPFAELDPRRVEAPFVLAVRGHVVRGRIDAVYDRDGRLELVDFKTGRPPAAGDAGARTQLDLYGLAAVDTWRTDPSAVRTSYCYLRGDGTFDVVSEDWDAATVDRVRDDLATALDGLAARRFGTTPGPWCVRCGFLAACPPGRRTVAAGEAP